MSGKQNHKTGYKKSKGSKGRRLSLDKLGKARGGMSQLQIDSMNAFAALYHVQNP